MGNYNLCLAATESWPSTRVLPIMLISPRVCFKMKWCSANDYANQENEPSSSSLVLTLTYDEPLLSGATSIKRPIFGYEEKKKIHRDPGHDPSLRFTDHRFSGEAEGIFPRGLADSSGGSNSKKVPRVPRAKSRQLTVKANAPCLLIIIIITLFV